MGKVNGSAVHVDVRRVDIGKLVANPWNPNRMAPDTIAAAEASIKSYGFVDPVTVRLHPRKKGYWQILDGEHRWIAAKNAGWRAVSVNVLTGLTEAQAKRLTVVMNETRWEAEKIELGKLLAELKAAGDDFAGVDMAQHEIDELIAIADVQWEPAKVGGEAEEDDGEYHFVAMRIAERDWPTVEHRLAGLSETLVKKRVPKEVALGRVLVYLLKLAHKKGE
jgi:ParB/RepB/Spo0J family partition protein